MNWEQIAITARRYEISQLLASSPHPLTDRLILKYKGEPLEPGKRYTIKRRYSKFIDRMQLVFESTENEVDTRTAATHALIYACWCTDLELVLELIQDLRELIDINSLIGGENVLDWVLASIALGSNADTAVDICRLLVVCYGSKLNVRYPESIIMQLCSYSRHADVVAYLVVVYDSVIEHAVLASDIFRCLVTGNQDEVVETYLRSYKDYIEHLYDALIPASIKGSTPMFRLVLDMFEEEITACDIEHIFMALCSKTSTLDWDNKIVVAFKAWADRLTSRTIELSLVENWVSSMTEKKKPDVDDRLRHMAHTVIRMCIDLLQDQGIEIALALCCYHVSGACMGLLYWPTDRVPQGPQCCCLQDLELLDLVLARNLDQIQANPQLARHALIECANRRDIDTFEYILTRVGPCVCTYALEFWCEACDLEAVSMVLDAGAGNRELLRRAPVILELACARGDAEMVELLTRVAYASIEAPDYGLALLEACHNQHEDVIRVIADCNQHIDLSADAGIFTDKHVKRMDSDIIELVNTLFGTSIDSTGCPKIVRELMTSRGQSIRYCEARVMYPSYRIG